MTARPNRQTARLGLPQLAACVLAIVALALGSVQAAGAATRPATTIAGPNPAILDVGNTAIAADGSGGIIWRQLVNGVAHVFVSQFHNGSWSAPIQADAGQPGPATFEALAAGDGGRLLAVWVQPFDSVSVDGKTPTTHYELYSAELQPGASSFGPAEQVDPQDVGDGSGVYPDVAMAPNGNAYVVYRVVTNNLNTSAGGEAPIIAMRPGDELVDVRVARFNGLYWSSLGAVNALPGEVTDRPPTASNAPAIAVDREGDAIVVWQEPTIDGVARIWARRLFGLQQGSPLQASPQTLDNKPVTADADAPAVSLNDYGGAAVAFRLQAGAGNPLSKAAIFVNTLPSTEAPTASAFGGAQLVGSGATVGAPSASIDDFGKLATTFTSGSSTDLVTGPQSDPGSAQPIGTADAATALTATNPAGGNATVWPSTLNGIPVVSVRQTMPGGGVQINELSAPISGPVSSLTIAPTGQGDALIGFQQGFSSTTQVMATSVQAPPQSFSDYTPNSWVTPRHAVISWDLPVNSIGRVAFTVLVDGHPVATGLHQLRYRLARRGLGQGRYSIRIVATDITGQETISSASELEVDNEAPLVRTRSLHDDEIRVGIRDSGSGANPGATTVAFGDGSRRVHGRLRITHRYAHPGVYRITVRCADYVGNRAVYHLLVRAR